MNGWMQMKSPFPGASNPGKGGPSFGWREITKVAQAYRDRRSALGKARGVAVDTLANVASGLGTGLEGFLPGMAGFIPGLAGGVAGLLTGKGFGQGFSDWSQPISDAVHGIQGVTGLNYAAKKLRDLKDYSMEAEKRRRYGTANLVPGTKQYKEWADYVANQNMVHGGAELASYFAVPVGGVTGALTKGVTAGVKALPRAAGMAVGAARSGRLGSGLASASRSVGNAALNAGKEAFKASKAPRQSVPFRQRLKQRAPTVLMTAPMVASLPVENYNAHLMNNAEYKMWGDVNNLWRAVASNPFDSKSFNEMARKLRVGVDNGLIDAEQAERILSSLPRRRQPVYYG